MFEFLKPRQDKELAGVEFADEVRRAYEEALRILEANSKGS